MRKIKVTGANKPHGFWQIRLAAGILVRCVDGTRCNHFAILPAFPLHLQADKFVISHTLLDR